MGVWVTDNIVSDNWEIPILWAFGLNFIHKIFRFSLVCLLFVTTRGLDWCNFIQLLELVLVAGSKELVVLV